MESSVENNQNHSNNDQDALTETIQIVKDEKTFQNCKLLAGAQFGLQDLKGSMMDVRTADGSIVKIQTNMQEQELVKTLGVDIVQNMYKVNVDDLNQMLAYHEIFGKLQGPPSKHNFDTNTYIKNFPFPIACFNECCHMPTMLYDKHR